VVERCLLFCYLYLEKDLSESRASRGHVIGMQLGQHCDEDSMW